MTSSLRGAFAAAVTPLDASANFAPADLPILLDHLRALGCDGALLLGTTGEGPSLGLDERIGVFRAAKQWRERRSAPSFKLIAGTGCANLPETIAVTRGAFDAGMDAALLLPPFYYKSVGAAGLTEYYRRVVDAAVPDGWLFLLYHIPPVSGIAIPIDTIEALQLRYPDRLAGLKDSGGDLEHTLATIERFPELAILTGTDNHLLASIRAGGAGAITAIANVFGDILAAIIAGHAAGEDVTALQLRLTALRQAISGSLPVAAVKYLLTELHDLPEWTVRPPLEPLSESQRAELRSAVNMVP